MQNSKKAGLNEKYLNKPLNWYYIYYLVKITIFFMYKRGGGGGGGGGIGYQVSDITSTKCSFGFFSLDTPTPFAVLTVFLDNT